MSITVHHADSCPYCVRIRLVLNGKGINADLIDVDLSDKPPYLRELNPRNRVPVIEHEGHVISESEALNEYLNEIVPDPPMMPASPAARARVEC